MKQVIVFFLVMILLLPISFAIANIYSGDVITGTNKVLSDGTFGFTYEPDSKKAFVTTPTINMIVPLGDCRSNSAFKVCVKSADYYDKNVTTYVFYYKLGVDIYKLTGALSAATTMDINPLMPGQTAIITIKITNPTDFDATKVDYAEDFMPLTLKNIVGCDFDGSRLKWSGIIKANYFKTCTANAAAKDGGSFSFAGTLNFFDGFGPASQNTDTLSVTVKPKQLQVNQLADKYIEVNQPFYINVSLANINPDAMLHTLLTIDLPGSIVLLKRPEGFSTGISTFGKNFVLGVGSSASYSLYLKALTGGSAAIKQRFEYSVRDISDFAENFTVINAVEPKPIINFTVLYNPAIPGQTDVIIVKLANPSQSFGFTGIKANLNVPFSADLYGSLDKLAAQDSSAIISNQVVIPRNINFAALNNTLVMNLNLEYILNGAAKYINNSYMLKIDSSIDVTNASAQPTRGNYSAAAQPPANFTRKELFVPNVEIINESMPAKAPFNLFDRKILLMIGIIIFIIIGVPLIISKLKPKINKNPESNTQDKNK